MSDRMNEKQYIAWLNQYVERDNENPWNTYEEAKGETKRRLCGFPFNPDWALYDYYQPMIVKYSKVFDK